MYVIQTIYHDIKLVWTFFTRIPAPHFVTTRTVAQALWTLPVIALFLSGLNISFFFMLDPLIGHVPYGPHLIAIGLILTSIIATGALHWDGLADLADGLGVDVSRREAVMRDSSVGAFGLLAIVSIFSTQVFLFAGIISLLGPAKLILALALISVVSRQTMALCWAAGKTADQGNKSTKGQPALGVTGFLWVVSIFCLAFSGVIQATLIGLFISLVALWYLALRRWLRKASGDSLGATQVLGETALLFFVVISHDYAG